MLRKFKYINVFSLIFFSMSIYSIDQTTFFKERYNQKALIPYGAGYMEPGTKIIYANSGFGASHEFIKLLNSFPDSSNEMKGYSTKIILGNIFYWTGIAGILAPIIINAAAPQSIPVVINISFWGGGLLSSIIGIIFINEANTQISQAVWKYNRDVTFSEPETKQSMKSTGEAYISLASFNGRF